MSFIVEGQELVFESRKSDKGELFIEGCCMVADVVNKNKRLYPKSVMQDAVNRYNASYVTEMKALGELNHPARPNADPAEASHLIIEMKMVGEKVYAKARVLDTPRGKILRGLVEGGWRVQTSSRGLGNLQEKTVNGQSYNEVTDFNITVGFDVVQDQSAPGAVMVGVYESVGNDYVNVDTLTEQQVDDWSKVLHKLKENTEMQVQTFKEFSEDKVELDEAADPRTKLISSARSHLIKANSEAVKILNASTGSQTKTVAKQVVKDINAIQGVLQRLGKDILNK